MSMQLQLHSYYIMRNRPDIHWVYIDSINEDVTDWQCGGIYLQGIGDSYELRRGTWKLNGSYQLNDGAESPMDLVRELVRPTIWGERVALEEDVPWYV